MERNPLPWREKYNIENHIQLPPPTSKGKEELTYDLENKGLLQAIFHCSPTNVANSARKRKPKWL
jgi:hypothetical protein